MKAICTFICVCILCICITSFQSGEAHNLIIYDYIELALASGRSIVIASLIYASYNAITFGMTNNHFASYLQNNTVSSQLQTIAVYNQVESRESNFIKRKYISELYNNISVLLF